MEEKQIIEWFRSRDERAVRETVRLYGAKLQGTAFGILRNQEDAEECVNETLWKAWEAVPGDVPGNLKAYLLKICRNTAINMLRYQKAEKRNAVLLELTTEMEQCIPGKLQEPEVEVGELVESLDRFLEHLPEKKRKIFLRRYWYGDSVSEIAKRYGISEENVKITLFRIRKKLKKHLEKEGFSI